MSTFLYLLFLVFAFNYSLFSRQLKLLLIFYFRISYYSSFFSQTSQIFMLQVYIFCVTYLLLSQYAQADLNYITNGDFQHPIVPINFQLNSHVTYWRGQNFQLFNYFNGLGFGQYVDLQSYTNNGHIQKLIYLPTAGNYQVSFYRKSIDTNYLSHMAEVYWNQQLIALILPNSTETIREKLAVKGKSGDNILKFKQVGSGNDYTGLLIDQVSLTKSSDDELLDLFYPISIVISMPTKQILTFRYIYLFADDLWLYSYDRFLYRGDLAIIFNTTTIIEVMKFQFMDRVLKWLKYNDKLPFSQHKKYSNELFINIEGEYPILGDALTPYVIYTIPQNVFICILLYGIFRLIQKYQISLWIRPFYFLKEIIAKVLIEENLAYFTYICFGTLQTSFSFCIQDKLYIAFTTLFLFILCIFCLTFYFFLKQYLKKKSLYFIDGLYYQNPSYILMIFCNLIRAFLRGATHYFLYYQHHIEMLTLSCLQIGIIITCVYLQSKYRIFIKKTIYSLIVTYHITFMVFNLILLMDDMYFEENEALPKLFEDLQQAAIFSLISITLLLTIVDLIPLKCSKQENKAQGIQQCENNEMIAEIEAKMNNSLSMKRSSKFLSKFDKFELQQLEMTQELQNSIRNAKINAKQSVTDKILKLKTAKTDISKIKQRTVVNKKNDLVVEKRKENEKKIDIDEISMEDGIENNKRIIVFKKYNEKNKIRLKQTIKDEHRKIDVNQISQVKQANMRSIDVESTQNEE